MNKTKLVQKSRVKVQSTRSTILSTSNEMISEVGMPDFKIDVLSMTLGISPGNITYHFHKKEDIASALWDMVKSQVALSVSGYITPLLDVKQLFLLLRTIYNDTYEYRGVIAYKLGDLKILSDTIDNIAENEGKDFFSKNISTIIELLSINALIKKDITEVEMENLKHTLVHMFFWGFLDKENLDLSKQDFEKAKSRFACSVLDPICPMLTESGMMQFNSVMSVLSVE